MYVVLVLRKILSKEYLFEVLTRSFLIKMSTKSRLVLLKLIAMKETQATQKNTVPHDPLCTFNHNSNQNAPRYTN